MRLLKMTASTSGHVADRGPSGDPPSDPSAAGKGRWAACTPSMAAAEAAMKGRSAWHRHREARQRKPSRDA